jgi:hypothetical protein
MSDKEYLNWLKLVDENVPPDQFTEKFIIHMFLSVLMYIEAEKIKLDRNYIRQKIERVAGREIKTPIKNE